jgi:hypothetical protein
VAEPPHLPAPLAARVEAVEARDWAFFREHPAERLHFRLADAAEFEADRFVKDHVEREYGRAVESLRQPFVLVVASPTRRMLFRLDIPRPFDVPDAVAGLTVALAATDDKGFTRALLLSLRPQQPRRGA